MKCLLCVIAIPALLYYPTAAQGQILLGVNGRTNIRLIGSDEAVLEAGEERKDLPCAVINEKPHLGFDLRFHATYDVSIPLRELAGTENLLTTLFRVTPLDKEGKRNGDPVYFTQKIRVPNVEEDSKGEVFLQGSVDVGEGKYKIEWLMRDRAERVCSHFWEVESTLPAKDKNMNLMIGAGTIEPTEAEQFRDEPPVAREGEAPLRVKVLVNFAPQKATASSLQPLDTSALVSILRTISRDPRIGKFSVVAFNMHEQSVLYRQDGTEKIDFPAIGKSLANMKLGTIDLARLSNKNGETEFLESLFRNEVACETGSKETGTRESYDAVIFAGPKALLEQNVPVETLRRLSGISAPIFYMNYNLYPQATPWRDSIGHAVKFLKGVEYTISRPRDLWFSVSEMVGQIVKARTLRVAANAQAGQ